MAKASSSADNGKQKVRSAEVGTDILKALALGATGVLIGRPVLHALAAGGAPALAHLIQVLRGELEVAMALTGCQTLADVNTDVLWPTA